MPFVTALHVDLARLRASFLAWWQDSDMQGVVNNLHLSSGTRSSLSTFATNGCIACPGSHVQELIGRNCLELQREDRFDTVRVLIQWNRVKKPNVQQFDDLNLHFFRQYTAFPLEDLFPAAPADEIDEICSLNPLVFPFFFPISGSDWSRIAAEFRLWIACEAGANERPCFALYAVRSPSEFPNFSSVIH